MYCSVLLYAMWGVCVLVHSACSGVCMYACTYACYVVYGGTSHGVCMYAYTVPYGMLCHVVCMRVCMYYPCHGYGYAYLPLPEGPPAGREGHIHHPSSPIWTLSPPLLDPYLVPLDPYPRTPPHHLKHSLVYTRARARVGAYTYIPRDAYCTGVPQEVS